MKETLYIVPIKSGCLEEYKTFAKKTLEKAEKYADMLQRYDIKTAKIWCTRIEEKDYVFVHHYVGPNFQEKMKGWDTSDHPFDQWFRENMSKVYDTERPADMKTPEMLVDFNAVEIIRKYPPKK